MATSVDVIYGVYIICGVYISAVIDARCTLIVVAALRLPEAETQHVNAGPRTFATRFCI